MGDYNFFAPEVVADPYPLFDRLREEDPVYATNFGYWYVSRYDDANRLLRDPALGAGRGVPDSMGITSGPLYDLMTTWMMAIDGAEHTRVRRLISRAFTPRAVEAMRPRIQEIADALLDEHRGAWPSRHRGRRTRSRCPMEVVRLLFGVDAERVGGQRHARSSIRRPRMRTRVRSVRWARWPSGSSTWSRTRRRAPGDDMFSAMVVPDENGDALSTEELVANAVLLVTAGFETTMSLITLAVYALLSHPEQAEELRADPTLARNAVEETLRFEPAALSTTRCTPVDLEVEGVTIPGGSNILFSVVAGNRDPRRYENPGRFDITRDDIRPLTFGAGVHACIGAALGASRGRGRRRIAVRAFPALRLAPQTIAWQTENPTVRRPVALHVESDRSRHVSACGRCC